MHFIQPISLTWLLFLVPVIVLLYLLKLRRKEMTVSSVYLWSQALKDVQANAPFQKLRRNLLLFLQLLIVGLLVAGFARPFVRVRALGGKNVVVILDGSASMKATDVRPSRFEEARRTALAMVDTLGRGDQMMVMAATSRVRILAPFTSAKADLKAALRRAEAADTPTRLKEALTLAASVTSARPDSRIYLLSDGAARDLEAMPPLPGTLSFVRIGRRADNLGITALDVRQSLSGPNDDQIFIAVRNYSAWSRVCTLELYRDDSLADAREITVRAGGVHSEVFTGAGQAQGVLTARIDARDDLAADNAAYACLTPRREISVLLVTEGNLFLEKALNADPRVSLSKVSPGGYTGQPGYDIVIFDGHSPRRIGPGNLVFIGTAAPEAPVEVAGEVRLPTVLDASKTHPLTRFADLTSVRLARALAVKAAPWGQSVAEIGEGPLVVAGERQGRRSVFIGFRLADSDLPLRVAFPIFISNCVRWLAARPQDRENLQVQTGQAFAFETPPAVRRVTVTDPAGRKTALPARENPALFPDTERVGLYRISARGYTGRFAANLLSSAESDLRPADRLQIGHQKYAPVATGSPIPKEIWRYFLLAALAFLAFEWYAYHRRV
ncbi:MAG: VWA domain-containing protein [Armatimonadetes bacterium]|nr:VWA domain-containing protein [Armatimonadota bacterium]